MNPNIEISVLAGMADDHWNQIMKETTAAGHVERIKADNARKKLVGNPVPKLRLKLSYAIAIVLLLAMMLVQIVVAAVNAGGGGGGANLVR